jgi:cytochrome c biogenesis protein CcdA/glutaredoxin
MNKRWCLLLVVVLFSSFALAEHEVELYFFHSPGCPHCANMDVFLEEMQEKYSELQVHKLNVKENTDTFFELADQYGLDVSNGVRVPVIFVHGKVLVGENAAIKKELDSYINECVDQICTHDYLGKSEGDSNPALDNKKITIPAVISAAAVDAINPCAFAVLIVLLTTVLATKNKRKALFAGFAFTLSIFISYLLMGIGLYSAINASGVTQTFYFIVATLAILIGLFNLKDYLWYGKWFKMEVPMSWRPKMKSLIKGVTSVPGAFLIGLLVSLFLLPCTSGPYIVILGLLSKTATWNLAFMLLLLYNFIFVLPMIIITLAVYFGFTTVEKAEEWRQGKLKHLHLIAGVILVLLGIGMFIAMSLGVV